MVLIFFKVFPQKNFTKKIAINNQDLFAISNEDSLLIDITDKSVPPDTIRSEIKFEEIKSLIRFTSSQIKNDTLEILIYETNSVYHHNYLIKVVNGKFNIYYSFKTVFDYDDGASFERKIVPSSLRLVLNTSDFKEGSTVRGYTELKGKCKSRGSEMNVSIHGNFKAVIR